MPFEAAPIAGVCRTCRLPLTRTGLDDSCPRCLFGIALGTDDQEPGHGGETALAGPHHYGQFEVLTGDDGFPQELGAGSMGVTYLGKDNILHRTVALKVIGLDFATDPAARTRFLREARAAAKLRHANVASVFHYGEQDGHCYYAMELVEGETLEQRVRRQGPLPAAEALEIATQIARALAAAEAEGIVHRDLKPSNVMLAADGPPLVKVIDFGLAKAVSPEAAGSGGLGDTRGGFVGTPAFASPEQHAGAAQERIDTRSDIYSLGVTLWYLLAGKLPFVGRTLTEIREQQVGQPLPLAQLRAAGVPTALVRLLRAMLAVAPSARPQSARELLAAMGRAGQQLPAARRARLWRGVALAGAMAAAIIGTVLWRESGRPPALAPDPSLAVLPFENLSPDAADAVFTVGVQDEINHDLSCLAGLKVTSPESARHYLPGPRDLVAIGRELGVVHLLQGKVQRAAGQMDVQLSLTDLHDPGHPWTQTYHRPVSEVLDVRGEILRAVSSRLGASISPDQIAALSRPPTHDPIAYDLYLRTNNTTDIVEAEAVRHDYERKIATLEEVVARDPNFTLAYCRLAVLHDYIWTQVNDPAQPQVSAKHHRTRAEEALRKASALEPDLGEVHYALANHAQYVRDQPRAAAEAELACRRMPNSAKALNLAGKIDMRCNRWDQCIPRLERAVALDPLSLGNLFALGDAYSCLRRDADADRVYARMLDRLSGAEKPSANLELTLRKVSSRADLPALRVALDHISPKDDPDGDLRFRIGLLLRLFDGDGVAADNLLAAGKDREFEMDGDFYPKDWFAGLAANLRHDPEAARESFAAARPFMEKAVADHPGSAWRMSYLAMIDAALGRKEDAVREGLRACEMAPYEDRAQAAAVVRCNLAVVYAWTGQADLAFDVLGKAMDHSAGFDLLTRPTYGDLLLNPVWQSLRPDPRFQALVQKLAPKPVP